MDAQQPMQVDVGVVLVDSSYGAAVSHKVFCTSYDFVSERQTKQLWVCLCDVVVSSYVVVFKNRLTFHQRKAQPSWNHLEYRLAAQKLCLSFFGQRSGPRCSSRSSDPTLDLGTPDNIQSDV